MFKGQVFVGFAAEAVSSEIFTHKFPSSDFSVSFVVVCVRFFFPARQMLSPMGFICRTFPESCGS
jgi:hypothetical protein